MSGGKKKALHQDDALKLVLVLGLLGTLVSLYLANDHYNTGKSVCDLSNRFSCSVINKSAYSEIFNVPVAFFGVVWQIVTIGFTWKIWGNSSDQSYWVTALFIWSVLGVISCLYFIYAEFVLGAICPLCTVIHIICVLILGLSWSLFKNQKAWPSLPDLILHFVTNHSPSVVVIAMIIISPLVLFNIPKRELQIQSATSSLDSFAQCTRDKGVVLYGSDECPFCNRQKELFGNSFQNLHYINCHTEENKCMEEEVNSLPTWIQVKDGTEIKRHIGLFTLKELQDFTGCKIDVF